MKNPPAAWTKLAEECVLTPRSERVAPVAVVRTEGLVDAAEALLCAGGKSCRLTYEKGGPKPAVVLDFGKSSVGGYAAFTVTAKTGQPVVRLAYACHPDGLSETGCFSRETSARYLGPTFDLPILPANVNRHECYTIPRTGRFIAPLIQGQARYIRLQLDTEATSVDIDSIVMVNSEVYDHSPHDGHFLCSDERLNRLWYISTWTLQIASFPNHDAWKTVDGWLLPRKLEAAADIGLSVMGEEWREVTIETLFELRSNPHHISAAGIAFRAQDTRNAYLVEMALDGAFQLIRRQHGQNTLISGKQLSLPLTDGQQYRLKITAQGSQLITRLNGAIIDETTDATFQSGRVGFYSPKEKWPLYDHIRVTGDKGQELLFDDFSGNLARWAFPRTLSYVSDGAKRDRLVWSGDLYWAERNAFYAFAKPTYIRDSLKMLAFNQTPEGYVHAAPYPERDVPPASGEYGPFPSDEFAAWLVPVAWDYLLFTDDVETICGIWPAIQRLLAYLQRHTGAHGLFAQREETSKHANNLTPGDVRTRSFMNILLWGCFDNAARMAKRLGLAEESQHNQHQADALKVAITERLWDESQGFFLDALETPSFEFSANALALAMKFATPEQALRLAPHLKKDHHGKFQSLASRGKFEYGFSQSALKALFDHNWIELLADSWKGASTTTECMSIFTSGWGDESHPDTAIAAHFSAYILGVCPTEPGYRRFSVKPQPVKDVTWARGLIPTPQGPISAGWDLTGNTLKLELTVPTGTMADVRLPKCTRVLVNGEPVETLNLLPGAYVIEACDLAADAFNDPTLIEVTTAKTVHRAFTASSSCEENGWGIAHLLAPEQDKAKKGYRSESHPSADATEWIEIDLGEEQTLAQLVIMPCGDSLPIGFPRDFTVQFAREPGKFIPVKTFSNCPAPAASGLILDLYTVISYPIARYVRLSATRLGETAPAEPGKYALQLSRLRFVRPEEKF